MNPKSLLFGVVLVLLGVYQSVFLREPHFYSAFSIGLFLIFYFALNSIKKNPFNKWNYGKIGSFFFVILLVSIVIDIIGIKLGYWSYPFYDSLYDNLLKYAFEWTVPLIAYMFAFMFGVELFNKRYSAVKSVFLSLILFVIPLGLITEYINSFSSSWIISGMPLLNYFIGPFNLGFVIFGYCLMALITYYVYDFINGRKK